MSTHHRDCRLSALERLAQVEMERDVLLAAAENLVAVCAVPKDFRHQALTDMLAAIASVKGGV